MILKIISFQLLQNSTCLAQQTYSICRYIQVYSLYMHTIV